MKNTIIIALIIISLAFASCSSLKYKAILGMKNQHNELNPKNKIVISAKRDNFYPLKDVFKNIDNKISKDFVVIFSWISAYPNLNGNHFRCIIYDYKNGVSYYTNNSEENINKIDINKTDNNNFFKEEKFVLDNYLLGNFDLLKSDKFQGWSHISYDYSLLDLKTKKSYCFENRYYFPPNLPPDIP
jgi:hypothetical protein